MFRYNNIYTFGFITDIYIYTYTLNAIVTDFNKCHEDLLTKLWYPRLRKVHFYNSCFIDKRQIATISNINVYVCCWHYCFYLWINFEFHLIVTVNCRLFRVLIPFLVCKKDMANTFSPVTQHHSYQLGLNDNVEMIYASLMSIF